MAEHGYMEFLSMRPEADIENERSPSIESFHYERGNKVVSEKSSTTMKKSLNTT